MLEKSIKKQLLDILEFHKNPNLISDLDQDSFNTIKDTLELSRDEGVNIEAISSRVDFYNSLYDTYKDSIALFISVEKEILPNLKFLFNISSRPGS